MSQENVEIVRRMCAAWNRRDEEEMLALSDPEAEFVNSPTAVEPGTRRGTNEVLAAARTQWEFLRDGRQDARVVRTEVLGFGGAEVEKALEAAGLRE